MVMVMMLNNSGLMDAMPPSSPHTLVNRVAGAHAKSVAMDTIRLGHTHQGFIRSLHDNNESSPSSHLIHNYVVSGQYNQALTLFHKMKEEEEEEEEQENHPQQQQHFGCNKQTLLDLMKACSKINSLYTARQVHYEIVKHGFETNQSIGNTLVDMYGKCDSILEARDVFDDLPRRDLVSWNALISGYADHSLGEEALRCLEQMKYHGIIPDAITYLGAMKACASMRDLRKGQKLHVEMIKKGFESHVFLSCTMVDMYAKSGWLVDAQGIFDALPERGMVSWTVLMSGYADHGHGEEALKCLAQMQREGWLPNVVTFVCGLKACSSSRAIDKGRELHCEIAKEGFEKHPFINSALVDMYAKCGSVSESRDVFDEIIDQDIVSWTALIAGYAEHGYDEEALNTLEAMRCAGISPNVITLVCSLKACGNIGDIDKGRMLHCEIVIQEFEENSYAINTLVGMYAKCGFVDEALSMFEELPSYDIVSWNAMILGYAEQGDIENAFILGAQMQEQGLLFDGITFVCLLKAICNTEALETGKRIHAQMLRLNGIETNDVIISTAFIDMYSKCGNMSYAQEIFNNMYTKDHILWTALLTGYSQQGKSEHVFHLFDTMKTAGVQPNAVTFLSLLNACSHSGLIDKAYEFLEVMKRDYGIVPTVKHHNCILDLLSRAGQVIQAMEVLDNMPTQPSFVTWSTVLGHCRNQGNVRLAKHAFECAMALGDNKHSSAFILMSNMLGDLLLEEYEEMICDD